MIISFILTLVFTAIMIVNKEVGYGDLNIVFKSIASLFFIVTPILAYKKNPQNRKFFILALTGFVFSFWGDFFLALTTGWSFYAGLLSFAMAQVFFSIAFTCVVKINLTDGILFAIITALTIAIQNVIKGFSFDGKYPFIVLYTFVISFMLVKAISFVRIKNGNTRAIAMVVVSMVLFFISDYVLMFYMFYDNAPKILSYINLCFYYSGQAIFGLSFSKPLRVLDKD